MRIYLQKPVSIITAENDPTFANRLLTFGEITPKSRARSFRARGAARLLLVDVLAVVVLEHEDAAVVGDRVDRRDLWGPLAKLAKLFKLAYVFANFWKLLRARSRLYLIQNENLQAN